jgi:cyclopropane fatty-acyl-phospholipid synthase-like methyltransferase
MEDFMAQAVTSKDLFWTKVGETTSLYSPEDEVIVGGKKFADRAKDLQDEMFKSCDATDSFAKKFFSNPPSKILDLGAGIGANTIPMAKSGAHVTAIDQSIELLKIFSTNSVKMGCPKGNIRLLHGDIATMKSFGGPFNLVVALDILPYVPPTMLRSTMEKIHQCLEDGGILIGTIFTKNNSDSHNELMGKLGGHHYGKGMEFVEQFLKYSGFTVVTIKERQKGEAIYQFKAIKNT